MKQFKTKQNKTKQPAKKSTKASFIVKIVLILATSLLISVATYGMYLTKQAEYAANNAHEKIQGREKSKLREAKVEPINDNISILFVGIDDSEKRGQGEKGSRSDALILATLNNKQKTIKMVSIPRDSYVYIPYVGYEDKITHAHAYGGTLASIETVEKMFNIPIDYYVRMNFNAFIDIVDALGGIEVEVPYTIRGEKDEFDRNTMNFDPGLQLLDGRQALAIARTRKQDSDFERGKRQQEILKTILQKASSIDSITKYDDIIRAIGDNMKTDMTFDEMKSFFSYIKSGVPATESLELTGTSDMSTGVYYYKLDEQVLADISNTLQTHLELPMNSTNLSNSTSSHSTTSITQN